MADKNSDLNFSDNDDEFDNDNYDSTSMPDDNTPKKDLTARRRLDDLMEEKRLSKLLRDDFEDW